MKFAIFFKRNTRRIRIDATEFNFINTLWANKKMKRLIFILSITIAGIIASFYDAYWGLLLYEWYAFASPLELSHETLVGSRLSLIVASVVVVTTLAQKKQLMVSSSCTFFCLGFLFICFCSLAVKLQFSLSFIASEIELIAKLILMALIVPVLLTDLKRIRLFILVVAISTGFLGCYYGVFGLFAGSSKILGPGRIGDNNGYAVWLVTSVPFIYFIGLQLKKRWMFIASRFIFFGNLLAIALTFSRGGLLACILVCALLFFYMRNKALLVILAFVALPPLVYYTSVIFLIRTRRAQSL